MLKLTIKEFRYFLTLTELNVQGSLMTKVLTEPEPVVFHLQNLCEMLDFATFYKTRILENDYIYNQNYIWLLYF